MGKTTREGTTKHTFCVVGGVVRDRAEIPETLLRCVFEAIRVSTYLASHFPDGARCAMILSIRMSW